MSRRRRSSPARSCRRRSCSTQAAGTGADITGAQANLAIKQNALARQQALLKQGFTTRADYDDALNEVKTAEQQLADAKARAANAHAAIAPGEQPQIAQAQAAVDKARLDLSRTDSPRADGRRRRECRQPAGRPDGRDTASACCRWSTAQTAWVEANFKEKDVGRMVPGQRAEIRSMPIRGQKFAAHVQSIGAGTGSEFSLLPAQNANGNWVKVTQRVPVRIAFNGTPSKPMIAGLSVDATVYLRQQVSRELRAAWPKPPPISCPRGQRLIVTVGVMAAVLLQVLDTTIANVALPHMQASLSATQDTINWVLTSYIVASAIALPISGWLADRVGRKRLLLISVVVFTVASVLCATATSLTEMVVFRALQGVGGAFIVPLAQATLFDINPREKHGQAMALFGGGVMIGPILGPVLGGWLTDNYNWRWVFLVNLPVGILCILLMARFMPKTETHERKFDMFGFALLAIALAALQFCLDRGEQNDWFSSWEIDHRGWPCDRRGLDVPRPHDHRQASAVRSGDVQGPQFRDEPGVHGGHRRSAACGPRAAAAAAAEHVRLFGAPVRLPDRAARHRDLVLDADRRPDDRQDRCADPRRDRRAS